MKKYGLQLRNPPSQQKQQQQKQKTLAPPPSAFLEDDEDDVEREIARQASKNKTLKDIENQHKKALEEDPSVFDYDGVYDDMKAKIARPLMQDRQERKPKYIQKLMEKAKEREMEHEIVYERKLAKERQKDDHLYADKEKFVTSAYKKKLAETQKWLEEERLRELREERDDVTKKKDLSDFYFNLSKNVAFGGKQAKSRNETKQEAGEADRTIEQGLSVAEMPLPSTRDERGSNQDAATADGSQKNSESLNEPDGSQKNSENSESLNEPDGSQKNSENSESLNEPSTSQQENVASEKSLLAEASTEARHKRSEDAVAAAKERYLARKRARQ